MKNKLKNILWYFCGYAPEKTEDLWDYVDKATDQFIKLLKKEGLEIVEKKSTSK